MVVSSKCAELRPKKTDTRTQFTFLGRSAAGRRMTAEDEMLVRTGIPCSTEKSTLYEMKTYRQYYTKKKQVHIAIQ